MEYMFFLFLLIDSFRNDNLSFAKLLIGMLIQVGMLINLWESSDRYGYSGRYVY